jgi:hypothetical protein
MFPLEDREIETNVQEKNKKSLRGIFNQYTNGSKIKFRGQSKNKE